MHIYKVYWKNALMKDFQLQENALLHFRTPTPPIVIDDSSLKNTAESFTIALTLTLGGYKSAIAPNK